jgi:hypothetical protein
VLSLSATLPPAAALLAAHAPMLDDPLQILHDPTVWVASWLGKAVAGNQAVNHPGWLGDLFTNAFNYTGFDSPESCAGGTGTCTYFSIWHSLQASGYVVLGLALMFRMVKVVTERSARGSVPQFLVTDVLIRGSLAAFAINVSYVALAYLMHGSIVIGSALYDDIMSIAWGNFAGPDGMQRATVAMFSNVPAIPVLAEAIAILYIIVLLLASRVAMLFAISVAPLLIPIYAFSGRSSLLVWWLRIVGQGLLVPIVLGALFPVAMSVILTTETSTAATSIGPLLGPITAVAALWFVGHAIKQLLGYLFPGHSGIMVGFLAAHARVGGYRKLVGM